MNKENNERFQATEKKILSAYGTLAKQKPIDKITVSDICQNAGIHRTSFYGHFQNILELETYVCNLQFQNLLAEFITEGGWDMYEGILSELHFFYQHRNTIRKNFTESNPSQHISRLISEFITPDLHAPYMKKFNLETAIELDYHNHFISTGFTEIIKKWVLSDCRETPEEIAKIICKFLE